MAGQLNKTKVLGELFDLTVMLNERKERWRWRRLSPATKEVMEMLDTAVRACAEAVRNDHPLMFEIHVWEQLTLTGFHISMNEEDDDEEHGASGVIEGMERT